MRVVKHTYAAFACTAIVHLMSCTASAQPSAVALLRTGMNSDAALAALRGQFMVSDTIASSAKGGRIMRLAPVIVAGLEGLLVLHVDSSNTLTQFCWSRNAGGTFARSDALNQYTGWSSWTAPTKAEFEKTLSSVESTLGVGTASKLRPMLADGSLGEEWHRVTWDAEGTGIELWFMEETIRICGGAGYLR
jgi:hypothetical protein